MITDEQIMWLSLHIDDYATDLQDAINSEEFSNDEIEFALFGLETLREIRNKLSETRKIRCFDGWETIVPTLPMH